MADAAERPLITPELTVAAFLDAYPELEETLIAAAPPFAKLRSPVLRRTVARLTSLRQAAAVGGVAVGDLIRTLRMAAGQADAAGQIGDPAAAGGVAAGGETGGGDGAPRPGWLREGARVGVFDARPLIDAGEAPLPAVMAALAKLAPGQVLALVTSFEPAPLIDRVREAGYGVWSEPVAPGEHWTHCCRLAAGGD
ncbi:MAG TPA: DUF2249 domain-containing protein [Candidatus Krumholzibacteria bacterium]|nr:DUF2249 domain-containing protein [Candidatus Krumholzibacteria bacterium]HPD70527.1 DUF2249 domain-containing protein [Candidatus Krumholzibacteria bacterium]HRY39773.1 DUF2249 domain-containing protein [Candidatus Krumholzibacteria bacterium]